MPKDLTIEKFSLNGLQYFLPSVSVNNVIFGFHQNELKVSLLQLQINKKWALPGGYIFKDEEIEDAAARILKTHTGINNLFLQQFHVFGRRN